MFAFSFIQFLTNIDRQLSTKHRIHLHPREIIILSNLRYRMGQNTVKIREILFLRLSSRRKLRAVIHIDGISIIIFHDEVDFHFPCFLIIRHGRELRAEHTFPHRSNLR